MANAFVSAIQKAIRQGQLDIEMSYTYGGPSSYQSLAVDLNLLAAVGSSASHKHVGPIMGHTLGANLTKTQNTLFGVAGKYTITGVKATTYPAGGLLGIIGDLVTEADGPVVSVIDGDSGVTKASAYFKAKCNNSTPGSGCDFGLDVGDPAHDGYLAVPILKAIIRGPNDLCWLHGEGAPVDGVAGTGAGFAGPGSEYTDITGANKYINANTKASPTWKLVTRAA